MQRDVTALARMQLAGGQRVGTCYFLGLGSLACDASCLTSKTSSHSSATYLNNSPWSNHCSVQSCSHILLACRVPFVRSGLASISKTTLTYSESDGTGSEGFLSNMPRTRRLNELPHNSFWPLTYSHIQAIRPISIFLLRSPSFIYHLYHFHHHLMIRFYCSCPGTSVCRFYR